MGNRGLCMMFACWLPVSAGDVIGSGLALKGVPFENLPAHDGHPVPGYLLIELMLGDEKTCRDDDKRYQRYPGFAEKQFGEGR